MSFVNLRFCHRYADLVEKQRLSECCAMVKHIRKGMSMVIPLAVRPGVISPGE